ncbi:hypothetical protein [Actinoplanes sp. NPDC049265]|uniref:hypothetical protein n=1 Tax=Actinoplanes sp. NPDC049265 TaxID=3363902 RepID=UPI003716E6BE
MAFTRLYDALDGNGQEAPVVLLRTFSELQEHKRLATEVAKKAADGTLTVPEKEFDTQTAFGWAVGLHDALRRADPVVDANPPRALTGYRDLLAATNNLLPDLELGALVACHVQSRRPHGGPTQFADFFPNLRRINSPTFGQLGWARLPRHRDLPIDKDLTVASLPFLGERADVTFDLRQNGSYYAARPATDQLISHVPAALAALDKSGAQFAVLPEAALDDRLLDAWQSACRASAVLGNLRLLLAGTGPVTVAPEGCLLAGEFSNDQLGVLPHNRAVLLDRATGEVVLAQDKQRGFSMTATFRRREGLLIGEKEPGEIDERVLDELMTDPTGLNLFDSRSCRIAILICEDLGRVADTGALVFVAGVGMVLAPVLAPPLLPDRWQERAAKQLTPDGADVVVVNSLAFGREDLDEHNDYKRRVGVPAASAVAITGSDDPIRRPEEHEGVPPQPRDDALRVRLVTI